MPTMTRSILSISMPSGRNRGKTLDATNRIVISGTPRIDSIRVTLIAFTAGRRERRPSASRMEIGKPTTTVPVNSTIVSGRPPHSLEST